MPLIEVIVGEETSPGDGDRRLQLRPGDPQAADRLRRGPRLRRQPRPDGDDGGDLARPGGAGPLAEGDRRGDPRRQPGADGPVLPHRPARPRHRPPRRRTPQRVLRRELLRPQGAAAAGRRRQARRQERRRGLLQGRRADDPRRRRARRRRADRDVLRPRPDRGLQPGRGGRLLGPRHRRRDDGRLRPRPAQRPAAAVLESRRRGPRRGARADREPRGEVRRALRAAGAPQAARRPGPARPQIRPGLLPLPAARRGRAGRDGQARDPRRGRDRLAREPADERDLAAT